MSIVKKALVSGLLFLPLPLLATTLCVPIGEGPGCPVGEVNKYCPFVQENSCGSGIAKAIWNFNVAPDPVYTEAVCSYASGGYHCEAWPKQGGVTYAWSKMGMLQWVNAPYLDDTADVTCTPGSNNRINLTVTSPYGYSTTTTTWLYCGYAGEY